MTFRTACAALGAALLVGVLPLAASADTGVTIGAVAASTGLGGSLGYQFPNSEVVLRAQSGNYTYNFNFTANGDQYVGHFNLNNLLVDAEFHPQQHSFYVAGGAFFNNDTVTGTTSSTGVILGGTTYGAGTASALVVWPHVVPYVGIGFAPVHGGFGFDLGAAFQGSATATVTTNIVSGPQPSAADIASSQRQIQNAVNKFQVYPVIGIRYTVHL